MLKSFFVFALISTLLFSATGNGNAEEFLLIEKEATFFSLETLDEESALFLLPRDFYLTLIEEKENCYKVGYGKTSGEYLRLVGYVKKSDAVKATALSPLFPEIVVTALKNTAIYENADLKNPICSVLAGQSVAVFGLSASKDGAFAIFGGELGYIPLSAFESFETPTHPVNTEKRLEKEKSDADAEKETEKAVFTEEKIPAAIQNLLFVFIAIPVFTLTALVFSIRRN